jgi:serine protease Do
MNTQPDFLPMRRRLTALLLLALPAFAPAADPVPGATPFAEVTRQVNERMVKIFGAGGFRGATNYSTGILVSADGHFLTTASQTLDTSELIVHLADGRRMKAGVLVTEPELDAALCQIKVEGKRPGDPTGLNLKHFYDIAAEAKKKPAEPGDWVLAFSNLFEIAMRDEPMSVMQGTVVSVSKLHGRRGIFDFPYTGEVYVVDAITNGPGAGGGALTTRKGDLLGVVGREIKNSLSETWINYAIPLTAKVDIRDGDKTVTVSLTEFVDKAMKGQYKPVLKTVTTAGPGGYTGIKFVPNILDRTPPYVDEIYPDSPAAKAGIQVNDLISFIDGEPIYSIKSFNEYMKRTRPDMVLRVEVRRGDNLTPIELKLADWPKGMLKPTAPPPAEVKK